MKIVKFEHSGEAVNKVMRSGGVLESAPHGRTCVCGCSDGFWLTIIAPEKNGVVTGVRLEFGSYEEQQELKAILVDGLVSLAEEESRGGKSCLSLK